MRPIRIVDYDPIWPALFQAMKAELLAMAGVGIVAIEHIGSTAVPGLAAKPKSDLDTVLVDETAVSDLAAALRASGFRDYGDLHGEGRRLLTREHDAHGLRLYLCLRDNPAHRDRLLFRDHLRRHPERAAEYQSLKRRLAIAAEGDWDLYTGGKAQFIAETIRRAESETGMQSPPHGDPR
jgi:GrpB-like predicted nucleotidyltransferase (UPF0157 family)